MEKSKTFHRTIFTADSIVAAREVASRMAREEWTATLGGATERDRSLLEQQDRDCRASR